MDEIENRNADSTDDPPTLLLLKDAIAHGRRDGMAGQHLGAMCSARDDLEAFLKLWNEIKEQPDITVAEIEKRMRAIIECE